ncbi:SubName: Full=Uncharacterized protein {ECO:0000313/EMBL:CCA71015.1} [Serendipita indica DSM 11827]|nr:SubName: Full=Uncharacterized protein {ECO:0000313/EMBL:CCA71015.1} [Serendipita indica DSM 11827]
MSRSHSSWSKHQLVEFLTSEGFPHLPPSHPARISIRAGSLGFILAVLPSLAPLITSKRMGKEGKRALNVLKRELGPNGFPFAVVLVFGGVHKRRNEALEEDEQNRGKAESAVKTALTTFVLSLYAIYRLQRRPNSKGRVVEIPLTLPSSSSSMKTSVSLDLTIIFCVRALDALFQRAIVEYSSSRRASRVKVEKLREHLDVLLFTLASSRIMWCFLYQPWRLPPGYVKWINALAEIDQRLLLALRALRAGTWKYGHNLPETKDILMSHARDLGYPSSWGDPSTLPAHGGPAADKIWRELGVKSRPGIGGLPCELVHGDVMTSSCATNALTRWIRAFMKAFLIYLPVHTIPTLLVNPMRILQDPFALLFAISRSSAFIATFVGSYFLDHLSFENGAWTEIVIDGSLGGVALGCVMCCLSLYIERGKRRGEIALYVLPRGIRTLFKESWLRSGSASVLVVERFAFAFACATLVTFAKHDPSSLRGLSQWGLGFVYEGWDALRRKRRRVESSE